MQKISEKIMLIQEVYSLSDSFLAHILNCSPSYICILKKGKRKLSKKFVRNLTSFFKITYDLFNDDSFELKLDRPTMTIIDRLISLRLSKGFNKKEMADALDLPSSTIRSMESRGNIPSITLLNAYSVYFKISLSDLIVC